MPDAKTIKEQQREEWGRAAAGWRKHDERIRQLAHPVSQRLLELVAIGPGHQVLDIACGTGRIGTGDGHGPGDAGGGA